MPRRAGLHESTYFHVFNRGVDRQDIFADDRDQVLFEQLLADAVDETGIAIHAYSLMTNHFHAVIEADGDQLSDAMHRIGRTYAVCFNRTTGRTGPLCEGRFGAIPITSSEMLAVEGRYVHRNPVDIVGVRALEAYRFSSLPVYVGRRERPSWLTTEVLLESHGGDARAYGEFVRRDHPSDCQAAGRRPPLQPASLETLASTVCEVVGVPEMVLSRTTRGRFNLARMLLAVLAIELRAGTTDRLAELYGFNSAQSVRGAAARGRRLIARDREVAAVRLRVLDALATRK